MTPTPSGSGSFAFQAADNGPDSITDRRAFTSGTARYLWVLLRALPQLVQEGTFFPMHRLVLDKVGAHAAGWRTCTNPSI